MVFQDPMSSLNPVLPSVPDRRGYEVHLATSRRPPRSGPVELLDLVGIPDPGAAQAYPHQLSGGMRSG